MCTIDVLELLSGEGWQARLAELDRLELEQVAQHLEIEFDSSVRKGLLLLKWPQEYWTTLIQSKLIGRAQKVYVTLDESLSSDYDNVKAIVLKAYELVPEAYRQRFRNLQKDREQTFYLEFAREVAIASDEYYLSHKNELGVMSNIKPGCVRKSQKEEFNEDKYGNDGNFPTGAPIKIMTDHNPLTFINRYKNKNQRLMRWSIMLQEWNLQFSHIPGRDNVVADVFSLSQRWEFHKCLGLLKLVMFNIKFIGEGKDGTRLNFVARSFLVERGGKQGSELDRLELEQVAQHLEIEFDSSVRKGLLLLKVYDYVKTVKTEGEMKVVKEEVSEVAIASDEYYLSHKNELGVMSNIKPGCVRKSQRILKLAIVNRFPVKGVDIVLGNDVAYKNNQDPILMNREIAVVTRSRASGVDAAESTTDVDCSSLERSINSSSGSNLVVDRNIAKDLPNWTKEELIKAQKQEFRDLHVESGEVDDLTVPKFKIINNILYRLSRPREAGNSAHEVLKQILVPYVHRIGLMSLAHDNGLAGHFGIHKTAGKLLKDYYWPKLKSDVKKFVNSCSICQKVGKPNQVIPKAPLCPIPVVSEPFKEIIIDVVGPLPRTRSGNEYIFTMMDKMSRYPEAIPLRSIKSAKIVEEDKIRNFAEGDKVLVLLPLPEEEFNEDKYGNDGNFPTGTPIKIMTDHNPLTFINRYKNKNQRLMRWSIMLQEWNLQFSHIPGRDNVVADALSRSVG
ncbi:uncharacterized protein [Macrobrachium rosenbergii]|uniref:uncharacterized protein n=1 Tax=Macrobrachium rosenbergii TaxID=79674 RepID=UPI0034D44C40